MWTAIICLFFGILLGIAITLGSWIGYDKIKGHRRELWIKQMQEALTGSDFCDVGCGYRDYCREKYAGCPELIQDELEHNYCYNCPLKMAVELMDKYEV